MDNFRILQLEKLTNFKNFFDLENYRSSKNIQIMDLFIHSIIRTTRNFADSHICQLIEINFDT